MGKSISFAVMLLALSGALLAQKKTTDPGGTPNALAPEEFARLLKRVEGTWILNRNKSTLMSGDTLGVPEGYVYKIDETRTGVYFTNNGGPTTTHQTYDGKPSGTTSTIARLPIDEFTIDNLTGGDGRRRGRNTQVYAADGSKAIYIVRRVNEQGEETVISSVLYEKVPNGTPIPKPPANLGQTWGPWPNGTPPGWPVAAK